MKIVTQKRYLRYNEGELPYKKRGNEGHGDGAFLTEAEMRRGCFLPANVKMNLRCTLKLKSH